MALAVGVPIGMVTLVSALLSGALSALAGFVIADGSGGPADPILFRRLRVFREFSSPSWRATIRSQRWWWPILVAVLFVSGRSLQVFYQIPFAMVQLIQAIIVICVAASEFLMRHRVHWVR